MEQTNTSTAMQEARMYAQRVRLAKNWCQTAFSISFICLFLLLWSLGFIPLTFLFLVPKNQTAIFWVSVAAGIISLVFGFITFQGHRYGKAQLLEVLEKIEHNHRTEQ